MTDSTRLHLDIVTPDRLAVSRAVEMVVAPGEEGVFGAMAHHAPFISALKPGVIEIHEGGAITSRYAVSGGYAEISNNACVILAEQLAESSEIDKAAALEESRALAEQLKSAPEETQKSLESALAFAEAKLAVVG